MASFVIHRSKLNEKQVLDRSHPPVIRAMAAAASVKTFTGGELVTRNADHEVVAWDGTSGEVFGVVVEAFDGSRERLARVLVHGTVFKKELRVADKPVTDDHLHELNRTVIWAN